MKVLNADKISIHKPHIVKPKFFKFGYRYSSLQQNKAVILSATLEFAFKTQKEINQAIIKISKQRKNKQPHGSSAGSFFKNPSPEQTAGYLLEQVGAKEIKIGGIQVSNKHANFLINTGGGTFAELKELSELLQKKVWDKFQVELKREVEFVE